MVIPLLYLGRFLDSNTLTSWRWILPVGGILPVFFLLFPALIAAYFVSRLPLPGEARSLFLLVLFFASVVPLWSEPETIIDASRYFVQAKALKEYGISYFLREWGTAIDAWTDLPLIPFLYGLIFSLFGEARIYIQAFNTLLFAVTGVLTYLIGKELWDEETGLQAALLLLGIPYLLIQVPLMLVDVPSMFFLTLAIYASLSLLQKGGILRIVAAAMALFLALFSKYSTWPMLLIIPVMPVVLIKRDPRKTIMRTSAVLALAGVAAAGILAVRADIFCDQIALLRTFQWSGLKRWEEGWTSTFLFQTHPFVTGLALFGVYRAVRKGDRRFLVAGWFLVLVALLQIKRIRYIIPLFPLLGLMASYGLNRIRDSDSKKFIALSIAASSLVIAYAVYLPFLNQTSLMNLKLAGQYLDTLKDTTVEVYALPQRASSGSTFPAIPLLDYYTNTKIISPQEWPGHPAAESTKISSMRFTWEMKRPLFYTGTVHENTQTVVLIADHAADRVPGRSLGREIKHFDLADPVFKYQTTVTIQKRMIAQCHRLH